jgi:peptide/nickel transport system permease protein
MFLYGGFLLFILFLGIFGEQLAPHGFTETFYAPDGSVARNEPPSLTHPLGTTINGQDILSRVLIGARPTVITGLLGGFLIITIGSTIGITAGYVGGRVGNILMRITDFIYGVPLLPFAIVILAMVGFGLITTIIAIAMILWRSSARVLRSQVLQIKERPFIRAAKATGMGHAGIIRHHIIPNIAPMIVLFFALGIGFAILVQAGLAFVGVSDPTLPAWGVMLRNAYDSGVAGSHLWWSFPPGLLISFTVLSAFMFGRKYEEKTMGEVDAEHQTF